MQLLVIILALAVLAVLVILAIAATKPATFSISRTTDIDAAPDTIFPLINDFHNWRDWSPWEALDPDLKRKMSGAESGQGAVYEWDGNKKVGSGRMEIIEVTAPNKVVIKLDFLTPFEAHNVARFTMEPKGGETRLNWEMTGPSPFMSKVMQVFMNFDKMVGKDFEKGLASLKAIAERKRLSGS
ncbi:SRPBCC family protein [Aminobacter anthyllidis]|uniref:SRPBCC family protein n=1 Tax=Aminobacter anthyllidis TaxID=1035067 RepID=UPI0024542D74|nr:SRPBCC family protein [Aminobacter anthyllidis]MDH4986254.1 SRPBCC family protein [Aminobacter anthyllidis]